MSRPRILLADDHQLVLERVTALLQSTFEVVGVAHDGLEMVDEAMRLSPDIIVADISMPELDGIEAAHRLREMGANAPIVFLTIHDSPEFVEACLVEGALGFVLKARMKADLIPAIKAVWQASALYLPSAPATTRDFPSCRVFCPTVQKTLNSYRATYPWRHAPLRLVSSKGGMQDQRALTSGF